MQKEETKESREIFFDEENPNIIEVSQEVFDEIEKAGKNQEEKRRIQKRRRRKSRKIIIQKLIMKKMTMLITITIILMTIIVLIGNMTIMIMWRKKRLLKRKR